MTRRLLQPLASLALLIGLGACCGQDPPKESPVPGPNPELLALLHAHESPSLQAFYDLGPETVAVLREIAEDPSGDLVIRGRAVTAMQAFPGDSVTPGWLKALCASPSAPDHLKRKAELVMSRWGAVPKTTTLAPGD